MYRFNKAGAELKQYSFVQTHTKYAEGWMEVEQLKPFPLGTPNVFIWFCRHNQGKGLSCSTPIQCIVRPVRSTLSMCPLII